MNSNRKSIPNFQFKVRFNTTFNSWEVYTYRLGETDPSKAKWMLCTAETAHWYIKNKSAIQTFYHPTIRIKEALQMNDILIDNIVQAITGKESDSDKIKELRIFLETLVQAYMETTSKEAEESIIGNIKELTILLNIKSSKALG